MREPNDSVFALLMHKVAPFQFDIGYKVSSASIRDQVVRAQLVVRALKEGGFTAPGSNPLLICGAGVAGLAAAMEAEALELPFVLIEKEGSPGGVLKGNGKRYVSPTMYEWPATSVDIHSFPMTKQLPILGTEKSPTTSTFGYTFGKPSLIADFAKEIRRKAVPKLFSWHRKKYHRKTTISDESKLQLQEMLTMADPPKKLPPLTFKSKSCLKPMEFSAVLFTAGMAPESPQLKWVCAATRNEHVFNSETPGFWQKDLLLEKHLGVAGVRKPQVLVVGGGDGAIQDALRCLVKAGQASNTLAIWEKIAKKRGAPVKKTSGLKWKTVEEILRHILTLEGYTATGAMWVANQQIYKDLDEQYALLADNLLALYPNVKTTITGMLRKDVGSVYVSTRGGFSKCYALNRFLIHLFQRADPDRLKLVSEEVKTFESVSSGARLSGDVWLGAGKKKFDLIVSRIGNPGVAYQAIGLTGIKPERVEFGRVPVPLMAPPFK